MEDAFKISIVIIVIFENVIGLHSLENLIFDPNIFIIGACFRIQALDFDVSQ